MLPPDFGQWSEATVRCLLSVERWQREVRLPQPLDMFSDASRT